MITGSLYHLTMAGELSETQPDELARLYRARLSALDRCREEGLSVLTTLVAQAGQLHLARGRLTESRVKALHSVRDKARTNEWQPTEALERMTDLVGFRIVCNNIEDAYRIKDAILGSPRFVCTESDVRDYIASPQPSGYRAIHINAKYEVMGLDKTAVRCEIQVRTLAQEAWAQLSHYDLYKQGETLPPHIAKSALRLAALFQVGDEIAQDIREDVSRPLAGVAGSNGELRPEVLSFIYRRAFDEEPPEYLMVLAVQHCEELQCYRLDLLDRVITDSDTRKRISRAYEVEAGWQPSNETIFLLGIVAAVSGVQEAEDEARRLAREEAEEIEAIARRDLEVDVPASPEDLMVAFYDGDGGLDAGELYRLADYFGALEKCFCGAPIVSIDAFVERALEVWGLDEDPEGKIAHWLLNCGIETGDFDNDSICGYHGWALSRD